MVHLPGTFADTLAVLAVALGIEAAAGYPDALYRAVGHPVTWIGRLIAALERGLNRGSERRRRIAGCGALALLLAVVGTVAWALTGLAGLTGALPALLLLGLLCASLPAQRSLHQHVAAVETGLRTGGLESGRRAVSMIVGRDPERLDGPAVCRAAIESLAENFSDGIVAPAFWIGCLGLPGGALYKAINTADSMIGHRSPRYEAFGWAAARLDDGVNLPAARLAGLLIAGAAILRGADAGGALRAMMRDARRHRSPNAGWPEAAMAGALGLRLAGPRVYDGALVPDAHMGGGRTEATPDDIAQALALYRTACWLQGGLVLGLLGFCLALMG
ncbi:MULTISPECIES: adenosylcobinamide-phosphate synthase CbiB [Methylobacterium]|uniref:Cobalamin biosynthesis protein CobD n=1 Tax=Methylobacterium longum TaxID=767694 RepID=A0ABT8ATZ9_9HYPH|nr:MULTISPECIES: adenosylcobinamide-phosphate synthase CbiB [Methylobacterium]MCJ2103121.1 adenosylcobinamide-phosphate synthase CbiB [Methylobacterium sp. E-046]MDN3573070.1 adenosylcobinamide-phosphate synthase CbiB [Methylobacterium longum]GJE12121.1 Cobalamin biosynthesis protein CobD [Methylobacterium longum]